MNLELTRSIFTLTSTIGDLSIDGKWFCFTLEDRDRYLERGENAKLDGITAIPRGKYIVELTPSKRFQRVMPLVANVEGFSGVRIHNGNTAEDTEGCILVGSTRQPDFVGNSKETFGRLYRKLEDAAARGEEITLEVI